MKTPKIKNEKIFVWFYKSKWKNKEVIPTDLGKTQFYQNQSLGKYSIHSKGLDPYFFVLFYGKQGFDLQTREYQQLYLKQDEWWGILQIWKDWKGDRWILPKLLKWHSKHLPKWITREDITESEIDKIIWDDTRGKT
jgi:hypothetical protein